MIGQLVIGFKKFPGVVAHAAQGRIEGRRLDNKVGDGTESMPWHTGQNISFEPKRCQWLENLKK